MSEEHETKDHASKDHASKDHASKDHAPTDPALKASLPDENEAHDRRSANIFLLVAAVVLIGTGIWLVNAMIDARRADDCMSSGRRNCSPIEAPQR